MLVILTLVAAYLLLYAPGDSLLRFSASQAEPGSPRLLRTVLLSVCCSSWIGFVLAEAGQFSLRALLVILALVALLGRWRGRYAPAPYTAMDWIGVAIVTLTCVWVAPPLDTRILGSDSAGYLASGAHLARHGSMVMHDPILSALSPDLKRVLFPSVAPDRGSPPYLRLEGSLVMRSLDSDEVLPAFHHLLAVWVAVVHSIAGAAADEWTITLFAGLSMWAMTQFAYLVLGRGAAFVVLLLLLTLAPQYWYSRFLMPEVPAQFFLWSGLCCLALHGRSGSRRDTVLAGLAFGIAGLMRIENAAFLLLAGAAVWWCGMATWRDLRLASVYAPAALLWGHAAIHLSVFRTHYFGNLRALIAATLHLTHSAPVFGALAAIAAVVLLLAAGLHQRLGGVSRRVSHRVLLYALFGMAVLQDYWHGGRSLRLLATYAGTPTVIGGVVGLLWAVNGLWRRSAAQRLMLTVAAIGFAQVMIEPHALPVPIWTVRRAVMLVLPACCFGIAEICRRFPSRLRGLATGAIVGVCLIAAVGPLAPLRQPQLYRGAHRHLAAIATLIPRGACVLIDARLTGANFAPLLWTEREAPTILMSPNDSTRIHEIAAALAGVPLYWISDVASFPPQGNGIALIPIALYDFALSTPALETGAPAGLITQWQTGVALYAIAISPPP